MRRALVVAACITLGACGGGSKRDLSALATTDYAPGFIDLTSDVDEQLSDLMGSELMIASADCGDLMALEPTALLGRLSDGEIRCLEDGFRVAERQTYRRKISLLLMVDAWTRGDAHRWEAVVRRHLSEVDQSDPDLCYKFSLYLDKQGPAFAQETLKWADIALENRSRFKAGDVHVSRVYGLLRVKSNAATRYWGSTEERFLQEPSDANKIERDNARGEAKTAAREWLEYARQAGRDTSLAYEMCVSAAGGHEFCDLG